MPILAVGQPASGLDITLRFNGVLTDPLSITYQIFAASGTSSFVSLGVASGFRLSIGHYDARNTTIPGGYNNNRSWYIDWSYLSPASVSGHATEDFTVTDSLSSLFGNTEDLHEMVEVDTGLTITDDQFEIFLTKALRRLNRRLKLTGANALHIDEDTGEIAPEPSDTLLDLILLQVECLIVKSRSTSQIMNNGGIRIEDGDSVIDTNAGLSKLSNTVNDFCGELDDAIKDYMVNGIVLGDIITYDNSRICEISDHDGQGDGSIRHYGSPFDDSTDGTC